MRTPNAVIASLANLVGIGLGYVYLGRMGAAFVLLFCSLAFLTLASWLGLLFEPVGLYVVLAISVLVWLFPFVHCARIALREKAAPRKLYSTWWFYILWIAASWFVGQGFIDARPVLFGYDSFQLPSRSMVPTLQKGDYITVDTRSFREDGVMAGDLFVYTLGDENGTKYVKRIVALPGDTIEMSKGQLIRNGQFVNEPYLAPADPNRGFGKDIRRTTLGEREYFALGDNRGNSKDSRYLGSVREDQLHGTVRLRWFSYDNGVRWDRFPFVIGKSEEK